jgi:uncharacterized membrane protein YkoI
MKRYSILTVIAMVALAAGTLTAMARPQEESTEQARLAKQARITMEQAREVALKRAPGNVESAELEREHKRLVYSFDIRNTKGTIDEVQVSAITGKVVRVEHENKKQEAAEKRKEAKEKSGTGRKP